MRLNRKANHAAGFLSVADSLRTARRAWDNEIAETSALESSQ
jgi:hypothetical protein